MTDSRVLRPRTSKGLIELNRQIRSFSNKIDDIIDDTKHLARLLRQFSDLTFDKLSLDSVKTNKYEDSARVPGDIYVIHVLISRIKTAARYFDIGSLSLTSQKTLSQPAEGSAKVQSKVSKVLSRLPALVSRRAAERHLHAVCSNYVTLSARCEGIGGIIKRFEDDNKAIKQDIALAQRTPEKADLSSAATWLRLANVDLRLNTKTVERSEASFRRLAALRRRQMSFSSVRGHSETESSLIRHSSFTPSNCGEYINQMMPPTAEVKRTRPRSAFYRTPITAGSAIVADAADNDLWGSIHNPMKSSTPMVNSTARCSLRKKARRRSGAEYSSYQEAVSINNSSDPGVVLRGTRLPAEPRYWARAN